jgi:hypothetical protein
MRMTIESINQHLSLGHPGSEFEPGQEKDKFENYCTPELSSEVNEIQAQVLEYSCYIHT